MKALVSVLTVVIFLCSVVKRSRTGLNIKSMLQPGVLARWRKGNKLWQQKSYRFGSPLPAIEKVLTEYREEYEEKLTDAEKQVMLSRIGRIAFYLRVQRLYTKDTRTETPMPVNTFPQPALSVLYEMIAQPCRRDFLSCVQEVYQKIKKADFFDAGFFVGKRNVTMWRRVDSLAEESYVRPFLSAGDYFEFSTTASYFLCWYTMLGLPALKHLPYCRYSDRWFFGFNEYFAAYVKPRFLSSEKARVTNAIDELDPKPFRCARLSFCPDPCCARRSVEQPDCDKDPLNICTKLQISGCHLDMMNNYNFYDLIDNRLNISCECEERGMRFDYKAQVCVDVDECLEEGATCDQPNTVCVNTVGGYRCVCRAGFVDHSGLCVHRYRPLDSAPASAQHSATKSPMCLCILLVLLLVEQRNP